MPDPQQQPPLRTLVTGDDENWDPRIIPPTHAVGLPAGMTPAVGHAGPPPVMRAATPREQGFDRDADAYDWLSKTLPGRVGDAIGDLFGVGTHFAQARDYELGPNRGMRLGMMPPPGDPLDPSPEGRLARRQAQGYSPSSWHHETSAANESQLMQQGFDPARAVTGSSRTDYQTPPGTFMKPGATEIGVSQPPRTQIELVHRAKNIKQVADRQELEAWLRQDPEWLTRYNDMQTALHPHKQDLADLRALYHYYNSTGDIALRDAVAADHGNLVRHVNNVVAPQHVPAMRERVAQLLRDQGHEGLHIVRDVGAPGREVESLVVLDPSHIRSPQAMFDPNKTNSRSLMASLAAALGLGGYAAQQQRDQAAAGSSPPPVMPPR